MRWLVGFLLLANFSLFLWGSLRLQPSLESRIPPPEIAAIRLLVEDAMDSRTPTPISQIKSRFVELLGSNDDKMDLQGSNITCGELTWLESNAAATELAEVLQGAGFKAVPEPGVRLVRDGYWVLVPPLGDRKSARALLTRLRDNGIEDTWLMPRGPFQNAISLGLYGPIALAQQRAAKIRALDFDVEVRENYNERKAYRVRYTANSRRAESIVTAISAHPGLEHGKIPCQ